MRAKEFIIEYDQSKTIQAFGQKLIQALVADTGYVPTMTLTRFRRNQWQSTVAADATDPTYQSAIGELLSALESADPTGKKAYTLWLVKCYATKKIKLEDILSKGKDWLTIYVQLKQKNALPPEYSNINVLTFAQLGDISTNPELLEKLGVKKEEADRGQFQEILNNSVVRIIHPQDETAAKYYGRGTRWCTAGDSSNMFNNYNRGGPMFILLPKTPNHEGEKYQIHFSSEQFMDEEDSPVDIISLLTKRFGDITEVIKAADPSTKSTIMFADDDVLEKLLGRIGDAASEHIHDTLNEWEQTDDGYHQYLADEGFVDEDGMIDWYMEGIPSYADYNSDYSDYLDNATSAIKITPHEFKASIAEYCDDCADRGVSARLGCSEAEYLFAFMVTGDNRYGDEDLSHLAEWIRENIFINPSDLSVG